MQATALTPLYRAGCNQLGDGHEIAKLEHIRAQPAIVPFIVKPLLELL